MTATSSDPVFFRDLFVTRRLFVVLFGIAAVFALGFSFPVLVGLAKGALLLTLGLAVVDGLALFRGGEAVGVRRIVPARFSNGDENPVEIHVENHYGFRLRAQVLDEVPVQFGVRDARYMLQLAPGAQQTVHYHLRPTERGVYRFGVVNLYAQTPLGLFQRRYRSHGEAEVAVYPSFLQLRQYELLAATDRLDAVGVKKLRRLGHTMEFEHLREYVRGDDVRALNWKATARRGTLVVNQHRDERAQPVYCVIDTGRIMRMPFSGMTLLDYSINASLVLAGVALHRQDLAGLVTFSHTVHRVVKAERRSGQLNRLLEALYSLTTDFKETDFSALYAGLGRHLSRRSLLVLFTNFESRAGMRRQLPYLQTLARRHVVVTVFFENTELQSLTRREVEGLEEVYLKTIALGFTSEKREIVHELRRHGIYAVLTKPESLTAQTVNQYLALKARGVV